MQKNALVAFPLLMARFYEASANIVMIPRSRFAMRSYGCTRLVSRVFSGSVHQQRTRLVFSPTGAGVRGNGPRIGCKIGTRGPNPLGARSRSGPFPRVFCVGSSRRGRIAAADISASSRPGSSRHSAQPRRAQKPRVLQSWGVDVTAPRHQDAAAAAWSALRIKDGNARRCLLHPRSEISCAPRFGIE